MPEIAQISYKKTVSFGLLVGVTAIFIDASIAHGLWWENDPYWTYWVTKTFLITAIFIVGTSLLGIGKKPGLIITAIHTLILEIYYQWLSPVGLPQEPVWLSFRDLWFPGFIVHFLAIYAGYQIALWFWMRNQKGEILDGTSKGKVFKWTVSATWFILFLDGFITQGILLRSFPGITFFIQHLLIIYVFINLWNAYVGFYRGGTVMAALLLALLLTTYSMYLAPQGLPSSIPSYLGYSDLWLKSFPGTFISALIALWLLLRYNAIDMVRKMSTKIAALAILTSLLIPQTASALEELKASASASGSARMVKGDNPFNMESAIDGQGSIQIETTDIGNRWSHIQNIDSMYVSSTFNFDNNNYSIKIQNPMTRHPLGYTTWMGVAYQEEMHGNSGVGSIMLEINTEDKGLIQTPDGYLHIFWENVDRITMPKMESTRREAVGWIILIALNVLFWKLIDNENGRKYNFATSRFFKRRQSIDFWM